WKAVQLEDYLIDFTKLLGGINASNVAYAVCYIHSKGNFADLVMKVGSNDQSKVYLNGREIHRRMHDRTYIEDQDAVSGIELRTGLNVLVFKVVNDDGGWQGSVRFTDHADHPLKGITVTLDPDQDR
ncbi:MAG TPA: hypothetical protein VM680_19620, partial [Verrucomicrobiae bacterium]|nr:hypothetical protein [Verrucomicrobiae bacterium]